MVCGITLAALRYDTGSAYVLINVGTIPDSIVISRCNTFELLETLYVSSLLRSLVELLFISSSG